MLGAATLLSGCAAMRLVYSQGTDLAYWWIDGYADFDDTQGPRAQEAINAWFRWHRATQLPDYVQLLQRAQRMAPQSVTAAQVCSLYEDAAKRFDPMIERALPAAAELAQSLSAEQIAHINAKYEKSNKQFRKEYLQRDVEDRREAVVKRAVDRAESLYGHLDDAQRTVIEKRAAGSNFDPELWQQERVARQQEILSALRKIKADKLNAEQSQSLLRTVVRHIQQSPREKFAAYQDKLQQYNCATAAQVHEAASAERRHAAARKLKGWEDDARVLSASPNK